MKKFFGIFTRNWSLKLLALVLALVVFYTVRSSIRSPRQADYAPGPYVMAPSSAQPPVPVTVQALMETATAPVKPQSPAAPPPVKPQPPAAPAPATPSTTKGQL